ARCRARPRQVATETVNQREGLRVGYPAPRGNVRIVLTQLDTLLATPLQESPRYDPARRDSTPAFRSALARAIEREIVPAMRRYRDFLAQEYLPRARATIGVSSNPYGEECYRASIRATTGLELSADSIHRLGLATVAELEDAMRRIAERSFGTSDVATLLQRLRSDPGSTFGVREEMIASATSALERATGASPGRLSPQYVRSRAQVPGRSRAAHVSRDNPGPPPPGDDRAGARRRDPGDRALLLVARVRRGVGRVRRAARRRDGVVLVGHGAARRRRRHHPVRGTARRRHRDQRLRLDARTEHRLHPRPHAGAAAPRGGARGPPS